MTQILLLALNFLAINIMIFTHYAFANTHLTSEISSLVTEIENLSPQIFDANNASEFVPELKRLSESALSLSDNLKKGTLSHYTSSTVERILSPINNIIQNINASSLEDYTLRTLLSHTTSLLNEVEHLKYLSTVTDPLDLLAPL